MQTDTLTRTTIIVSNKPDPKTTGYFWQIVFAGNSGCSLFPFDELYESKSDAEAAARKADWCGLRYGARVKRVHRKG
jgi:hypothetical protein